VSAVKKLKEQEMLQHVVVRRIRADQRAQMTAEEQIEQTVQHQIENLIQPIELVGPSTSLATFLRMLMVSFNNTTASRQRTENILENSVMALSRHTDQIQEQERMIDEVPIEPTAQTETGLHRGIAEETIFALSENQP
jgi:hypothetical protein